MIYYFAYGSNLDYTRMFSRCESAQVVCRATLDGYKLVFMENNSRRIVANIIKRDKECVDGVIYSITKDDMYELDGFEGHPIVYKRKTISMSVKGIRKPVSVYIMDEKCNIKLSDYHLDFKRKYGFPKGDYFEYIQRGYQMFGLPQSKLMEAYKYSNDLGKKNKLK